MAATGFAAGAAKGGTFPPAPGKRTAAWSCIVLSMMVTDMAAQDLSPVLQNAVREGGVWLKTNSQGEPLAATLWTEQTDVELVEVCKLGTLEDLHCMSSKITDKGFKEVKALNRLSVLAITNTPVTGGGMAVISELPMLVELHCNPQADVDDAVTAITQCKRLKVLGLSGARFTDEDYLRILELPELVRLTMDENCRVTNEALRRIKDARKLRRLSCSDMDAIGDKACVYLADAPALEVLTIGGTNVSDQGVASLVKIQSLRSLNLSETKVTPRSLDILAALPNLEDLSFDFVRFGDEDIQRIEKLTKLKELSVTNSQLSKEGARRLAAQRSWKNLIVYPQIDPCADDE